MTLPPPPPSLIKHYIFPSAAFNQQEDQHSLCSWSKKAFSSTLTTGQGRSLSWRGTPPKVTFWLDSICVESANIFQGILQVFLLETSVNYCDITTEFKTTKTSLWFPVWIHVNRQFGGIVKGSHQVTIFTTFKYFSKL